MPHRINALLALLILSLAGCATAPINSVVTPPEDDLRPSLSLLASRWHQSLTPTGASSVTADALAQAQRWPIDQARQFIAQLDTNGNGTLELSESVAFGTSDTSLQTIRTRAIEPQFERADANGDGRLTRREANGLTWRMDATGAPATPVAVPVTDQDFQQADRDGDNALTLTEFVPLGVRASARALIAAPPDVGRAHLGSWISTIPWSH